MAGNLFGCAPGNKETGKPKTGGRKCRFASTCFINFNKWVHLTLCQHQALSRRRNTGVRSLSKLMRVGALRVVLMGGVPKARPGEYVISKRLWAFLSTVSWNVWMRKPFLKPKTVIYCLNVFTIITPQNTFLMMIKIKRTDYYQAHLTSYIPFIHTRGILPLTRKHSSTMSLTRL